MKNVFIQRQNTRPHKTVFIGALSVACLVPTLLFAQSITQVPSTISQNALFEPASDQEGKKTQALVASGGDGAEVVVGETAVITATGDSRFFTQIKDKSASADTVLVQGGFRLQIGSTPVRYSLGDAALTAKEAELLVTKVEGDWVVKVVAFYDGGSAEISVMVAPPAPEPKPIAPPSETKGKKKGAKKKKGKKAKSEEKPTEAVTPVKPPAPVRQTHTLHNGAILRVGPGGKVAPVADTAQPDLQALTERLKAPERSGPLLVAIDVEDPKDLLARKIDRDDVFEDIEIEEIEIEAGCVEICLD